MISWNLNSLKSPDQIGMALMNSTKPEFLSIQLSHIKYI